MPTCFIVQPFDSGPYDQRFDDVLSPAVRAAGLDPYRVDRDPHASIPIEQIESGIRNCEAVLADITTDNPNVWFELGFAIASQKEVVLICGKARIAHFPFDIQHRKIISYRTESPSDFEQLGKRVTERLTAILLKEGRLAEAAKLSPVADVEGLSPHELVTLVSVADNLDELEGAISPYTIQQDTERAGFTRIATALAVRALIKKGLIKSSSLEDSHGDRHAAYQITDEGMEWLQRNQGLLVLREEATPLAEPDDIPF